MFVYTVNEANSCPDLCRPGIFMSQEILMPAWVDWLQQGGLLFHATQAKKYPYDIA